MTRLERFFIFASLCLCAGVGLVSSDEGDFAIEDGGVTGRIKAFILQWGVFAALFFFCYLRRRLVLKNLRHFVSLTGPLPLALLIVVSTLWSEDPLETIKRGVPVLLYTLLGYYLGAVFDPDELARLYERALEIMVLLSILIVALLPSYGISHGVHSGDWRGAFFHKNEAGEMMALAFLTFGLVPPTRLAPVRRWCLVALSLLLLYKSNASSSIIAAGVVIGAQVIWSLLMMKRKPMVALILTAYPLLVAAVLLAKVYSAALFRLLGKDSSFTGRDKVWEGVLNGIARKPWLGYGYLAFWSPNAGNLILVAEKTSFVPSHAHNGYLNLLLHVGIAGMLLFVVYIVRLAWITIREGLRSHTPLERWFFSFLVLILVANLTESHIVEVPFFWVSMAAFYTSFSVRRSGVRNGWTKLAAKYPSGEAAYAS